MKKVVFASPSYGPVPEACRISQMAAIMYAANHGVTWTGIPTILSAKQAAIHDVRNRIVTQILKVADQDGTEGVLWCDQDIGWPLEGMAQLIHSGKDFVTGIYRHKAPDGHPVMGIVDTAARNGTGAVKWMQQWPKNVIAPIDMCGFGCVYTSLNLLRLTGPNWFSFGDWSEDFTFCRKAADAGFQLYVDTGVYCAHVGEREWTVEEYETLWQSGQHPDQLKSPQSSAA